MKDITSNFTLPIGTYWSCSDRYNGISSTDKMREAAISSTAKVSINKEHKIPKKIRLRLMWMNG